MSQSHHRKKHQEHLKHFQHRNEQVSGISKKGKSTWPLAIIGAVGGLLLVLFTFGNSVPAMIGGVLVAGAAGYFIGQRLDKSA
jgi:hypothetical protein